MASAALGDLLQDLEGAAEAVRLSVVALSESNDADAQRHMQDYLRQLESIEKHCKSDGKPQLESVNVPVDLLKFIDDGRNPELFMRESAESALEQNKTSRARVEAFSDYEKMLPRFDENGDELL